MASLIESDYKNKDGTGKSNAFFPGSGTLFWWMSRKVDWSLFEVSKGLPKKSFTTLSDYVRYFIVGLVAYYIYKQKKGTIASLLGSVKARIGWK